MPAVPTLAAKSSIACGNSTNKPKFNPMVPILHHESRVKRWIKRTRVWPVCLTLVEDEVHFGPSTSQNTYVLAHAFRGMWQAGDEIIVTNQDHEANSGAWRRLSEFGMVVKEWRINRETGRLELAELERLLSDRTRLRRLPALLERDR